MAGNFSSPRVHLVEAVDAGGRLLGDALDGGELLRVPAGLLAEALLDGGEEDALLLAVRACRGRRRPSPPRAEVEQQGGVAAVVEDHVRGAAVGPLEDLVGVVPVLLERLALVGEHRGPARGDGGGGVVLGREDVARGPADLGAEGLERLDQDGRLDRHVQRAGDAGPVRGCAFGVLLADGHEAGHLGLGDRDLLAAPVGQLEIGDVVVGGFRLGSCGHCSLLAFVGERRKRDRRPKPVHWFASAVFYAEPGPRGVAAPLSTFYSARSADSRKGARWAGRGGRRARVLGFGAHGGPP